MKIKRKIQIHRAGIAVNLKTVGLMPLFVFLMLTFFLGTAAAKPNTSKNIVADFTANTDNSPVVQFNDASTGNINSWLWDFGDGGTSIAQNPSHTYTAAGTYQVTLTVAQNKWWFDTTTQDVSVSDPSTATASKPVANFTAIPSSGQAPLKVQFNDTSTGSPTSWLWTFGDGASSTVENPSYTYNGAGTYGVTLTASNSAGSSSKTTSITVSPVPPIANFTANPTTGVAPLLVQFTDSSTGTITSWAWNFGDGATSSAQNPSHTYNNPGTFTTTLTVSNSGGSNTKNATITVTQASPSPPPSNRDLRFQPFFSTSPWNYPIGTGAIYTTVANLTNLSIGLNYNNHWTCSVCIASSTDRVGTLHFRNDMWSLLANGITINGTWYPVYNSGNPSVVENALLADANPLPYEPYSTTVWPANFYSTINVGSSEPSWPSGIHHTNDPYWSRTFNIPAGAVPSPDTDGNIAIFQPNGWVLDCYDAVVLADGDIVCSMASYIDSAGSGDGYTSGRRASLLPSFAGMIRDGEVTSGTIKHALVCNMSPTILKEQALWPAVTWDTNAGYSGTLPMGALLAIPANVNITSLGLTSQGQVLAKAVQDYGLYVADRGGSGGMTILADLNATDIRWTGQSNDLQIIRNNLKWVSNNSQSTPGGGGTPLVPLLP